ncbi:MAG: phosphoribosylanthranilate isomerase, partial [Pseudomonadota bacterium]
MTIQVKICGVRTPAILNTAIASGADFVGLVHFPKSPRHLTIDEAKQLVLDARGRIKTVLVTVDPDDELADMIARDVAPDFIQLHGTESPARAAAIKDRTGLRIVKAIPVSEPQDVMCASSYAGIADKILFDAKAPAGADLPGG